MRSDFLREAGQTKIYNVRLLAVISQSKRLLVSVPPTLSWKETIGIIPRGYWKKESFWISRVFFFRTQGDPWLTE